MELNLDQVLMTGARLGEMADVYDGINANLKDVSNTYTHIFSDGAPATEFFNAMNTLWYYCGLTQDALNGASVVVTRYVNAVCIDDDELRAELDTTVDDLNVELNTQEDQNGLDRGDLGARYPDVDPDAEDGEYVEEREYTESEKPMGQE